jgi:hypothetical protein
MYLVTIVRRLTEYLASSNLPSMIERWCNGPRTTNSPSAYWKESVLERPTSLLLASPALSWYVYIHLITKPKC